MIRFSAMALAAVLSAAALPGVAQADVRDGRAAVAEQVPGHFAQDPQAAIRNVERGRPGRRVGVRVEGDYIVVIWEYPGGRIAEIVVDARSGRIVRER
jgi:hypothetical protein